MGFEFLAYRPFIDPLPIWTHNTLWSLLLLPLCLVVSVVYKSIRCKHMSAVAKESTILFITIVLGMVMTALALAGITAFMTR